MFLCSWGAGGLKASSMFCSPTFVALPFPVWPGRCEGSLRCSTCHVVIMGHDMYKALGTPCEEEQDMLGITFRATPTSRLGCQVLMEAQLDGIRVLIPGAK